jgi:hypothetical protein
MIGLSQQASVNLAFACQVLLYVFILALIFSIGKRIVRARAKKTFEEELMRKQALEIQKRMLEQMEQQTQLTEQQAQFIATQQNPGQN